MSRRSGLHRRRVARQQRSARWMALAVAVLAAMSMAAAVLVSAQQGISAFIHGG